MWLGLKSINLIPFVSELCFVSNLTNVPHHLEEFEHLYPIPGLQLLVIFVCLALPLRRVVPFYRKLLTFISYILLRHINRL